MNHLDRLQPQVNHRRGTVEGRMRRHDQTVSDPSFAVTPAPDQPMLEIARLARQDIEPRARDSALAYRRLQRIEIDDWAARGVDEHQSWLRGRERLRAKQLAGFIAQRGVNAC